MSRFIRSSQIAAPRIRFCLVHMLVIGASLALMSSTPAASAEEAGSGDSCVDCHSDPGFLVRNKKLYEYFQQWQMSTHRLEGVTCSDCHGGNAQVADKDAAHGDVASDVPEVGGIGFAEVGATCGECHDEILEGFKTSEHFGQVLAKKQEKQGPTCVTCHGSLNAEVLDVNSVKESCARCHNEEAGIHPEAPAEAQELLARFLSIHRFYRYLTIRMEPAESKAFFSKIDERLQKLSVTWHTFDLSAIEEETHELLALLRAKREEVRGETSQSKK